MKRGLSWVETKEEPPTKKRCVEANGGQLPELSTLRNEVVENPSLSSLPTEICRLITTLKNQDNAAILKDQIALALSSKTLNNLIQLIWHEDSSSHWPKFYPHVMKPMDSITFFRTFIKLRWFSTTVLEVDEESEEFVDVECPMCDGYLESKGGEFGEIMTCNECVEQHGEDWRIEWKLDYEAFTCGGCDKQTPFKCFECDGCNETFCFECEDRRFQWAVYGADGAAYCNECATDCAHCADWGATDGSTCYRCNAPQCARCERYGNCENESVDSDVDDSHSEDSPPSSDKESGVDEK